LFFLKQLRHDLLATIRRSLAHDKTYKFTCFDPGMFIITSNRHNMQHLIQKIVDIALNESIFSAMMT
jgi:hypothetical protein